MNRHFGARPRADGTTEFAVWAPEAEALALARAGHAAAPMARAADGWFELRLECGAGTRYHLVLADGTAVPDPAARAVAGDVGGDSIVVDLAAFEWRHPDWVGRPWRDTVLYELHVGLMGGFRGVEQELPRLAALGVTAIELMPIAEFAGARNWGYDGVLPFAPDASYGTPEDLCRLVDACHGHGLMIFLDVVFNHFGPSGNHLPQYARSFFRDDRATPWGAAIDFRHPEVRQFFTESALSWLVDYRFDGLRLDAVHAIADAGWLDALPLAVRERIGSSRQVHLTLENDNNEARLIAAGYAGQWNDDFHHTMHVLLTGETEGYYGDYAREPARLLARCLAEGYVYQGEPSAHRAAAPRGTDSSHLPTLAFINFLQNHDQIGNRALGERLASLIPEAALGAAHALLLLTPFVPMLFMGEEFASHRPFLYFTAYQGALAAAVRDGRRSEFARFAAFNGPDAQERIPDPNHAATFEASRIGADDQQGRGAAFAELTRGLLRLRRELLIPHLEEAQSVWARPLSPRAVGAAWRLGGPTLLVLANFDDAPLELAAAGEVPRCDTADIVHSSSAGGAAAFAAGRLLPFTTLVFLTTAEMSSMNPATTPVAPS